MAVARAPLVKGVRIAQKIDSEVENTIMHRWVVHKNLHQGPQHKKDGHMRIACRASARLKKK